MIPEDCCKNFEEFRDKFKYGKPDDYTGHNKELYSVKDEEAYIEDCLRRWEWAPTKAAFAHQVIEMITDMEMHLTKL